MVDGNPVAFWDGDFHLYRSCLYGTELSVGFPARLCLFVYTGQFIHYCANVRDPRSDLFEIPYLHETTLS